MPTLPTFATPSTPPTRRVRPKRRPLDWCVHLMSLAVLLMVYAAGYSGGRDAWLSRVASHPACHPNLKP